MNLLNDSNRSKWTNYLVIGDKLLLISWKRKMGKQNTIHC